MVNLMIMEARRNVWRCSWILDVDGMIWIVVVLDTGYVGYQKVRWQYIFVLPERSSERDYVITDSVRSMYVYVCMCMYVVIFAKLITVSIHIHWCIPMGLGHNDPWVESHLWPQQMWGQRSSRSMTFGSSFSKKVHCIHILWCIFMGLGHNDPWVESHMWPQQMWGQRSSRGQWPLVQVFLQKRSLYPHTLMYFHGTWTKWSLGRVTQDLNRCGVKGHLGVTDLWFKFLQKGSLYPHTLTYFHGTWTQWSLGRVTHVTSTDVGSKVT